ncbi:hypothetical protein EMCRGX_G016279 [Ephydatia muelleri]
MVVVFPSCGNAREDQALRTAHLGPVSTPLSRLPTGCHRMHSQTTGDLLCPIRTCLSTLKQFEELCCLLLNCSPLGHFRASEVEGFTQGWAKLPGCYQLDLLRDESAEVE